MDDTVIGDGVTLTSRPESAGKDHGSSILRSGCTRERLKGGCVLRPVDRIRVRGGTEPAAVCEALDLHTSRSFDAFATTRSRAAGHAITY
jgi:class 3 adenylate cyclase